VHKGWHISRTFAVFAVAPGALEVVKRLGFAGDLCVAFVRIGELLG
jgi:hypothetical protein